MRAATETSFNLISYDRVSIHATRAGRDGAVGQLAYMESVSIHATRAGRDGKGNKQQWIENVSIHATRAGRDLSYD